MARIDKDSISDFVFQFFAKIDDIPLDRDGDYLVELCRPWEDGVVLKLLGKKVSFFAMQDGLKKIWKPAGNMEILGIDNGFYMAKFEISNDQECALNGGPWMVFDHYIVVR